jgi:hypothetical protein
MKAEAHPVPRIKKLLSLPILRMEEPSWQHCGL